MVNLELLVTDEFKNSRLDVFINLMTGDEISRATIQKLIKSGNVVNKSNDAKLKSSQKVIIGELFEISFPPRPKLNLEPIKMDIPIIYEDDDLVIINKPIGLASHGGVEDPRPSLVNGLLYHFKELSSINGFIRPGIVHRLDKPTSGLMVIAKNDATHIMLSKQFQDRTVQKKYFAWLIQAPKESNGRINAALRRHPVERLKMQVNPKGRKAITNYNIVKSISSRKGRLFSLAEVTIETGRTHQIRVHFQHLNCPVVGDMLYSRSGKEFSKYGLLLFSQKLKFKHPKTLKEVEFELPLPERFIEFEKDAEFY